MKVVQVSFLAIMFSAAARAFSLTAVRSRPRLAMLRPMSTGGEPDTSVVDTCTQKIKDALEATDVKVVGKSGLLERSSLDAPPLIPFLISFAGAYDDPNGSHISIEVVSAKFEGKRPVQRQQLVYKAIWEELQGAVHAVDSMVCKTPDES